MRPFTSRAYLPAGIALLFGIGVLHAGQQVVPVETPEAFEPSEVNWFKSFFSSAEYNAEETYVGGAEVRRGNRTVSDFDESDTIVELIFTPRISYGVLRLGAEWERFSFGFSSAAVLPNTLQSINLVAGLDTEYSESIIIRVEALPGVYGTNHLGIETVNVPVQVGGTYIFSPDLQIIAGVSIDVERKYPILPGGGIRWRLHRQWVLNAVLPKPRLEFEANDNLDFYVGANLKQTNFRVDEHFGDANNIPRLNNAVLTYSEVRTGIGFDWKISPNMYLTGEAGYQPYRNFDFYRAEVRYHQDGGAPYGTISLRGAF